MVLAGVDRFMQAGKLAILMKQYRISKNDKILRFGPDPMSCA